MLRDFKIPLPAAYPHRHPFRLGIGAPLLGVAFTVIVLIALGQMLANIATSGRRLPGFLGRASPTSCSGFSHEPPHSAIGDWRMYLTS